MRLFLLFILLLIIKVASPQKQVLLDTSNISVRSFDPKELQEFREDKDFQYSPEVAPSPTFWMRFWRWVWSKFNAIMRTKGGRRTVYGSLIVVALAVIVFFVMKVMGMNRTALLGRNGEGGLPFTTSTEDINSISFEDAIRDAIDTRNFRLAIRLLYLQTLKQLSDRGYIEWQIDKTNTDYIKEVTNRPWQSVFRDLSYHFEYAWYGERNIGKEEFEHLNLKFQQFNTRL